MAEIIEEALAPLETLPDPVTDCDDPEAQQVLTTGDALRAALKTVRPALARMPRKQRQRVCADIAARLRKAKRAGADSGTYAALAAARRTAPDSGPDLGRRIMEKRNANVRK